GQGRTPGWEAAPRGIGEAPPITRRATPAARSDRRTTDDQLGCLDFRHAPSDHPRCLRRRDDLCASVLRPDKGCTGPRDHEVIMDSAGGASTVSTDAIPARSEI